MISKLARSAKRGLILLATIVLTLLAVRVYDTQRGAPLEPWHTHIPHELSVDELDRADWAGYLKAEAAIFDALKTEVTQRLPKEDRVPVNRYFEGSPIYPGHFAQDWNRSYELEPVGEPVGAAVFLHGLTDSPYSLRHIARLYRERGFVSVAIRLPAHGTVPGALTEVEWEDWLAATRLAVREARRRVGPGKPLHLVGFSNGGALAMKYALDALDDDRLERVDRIVLLSPMVGITSFARFVGLAGLPAFFPAFAKAAWLSVLPEFNPFKYNSFPINGARQSFQLTQALQQKIARRAREQKLAGLPPILTFQSVMDFTVSTSAIVSAFYVHLPANGSELVLFDINRAAKFSPLLRRNSETVLARLLPPAPRNFRTTIITNEAADSSAVVEEVVEAGSVDVNTRPLGLTYPLDIFSLSHVALPFPMSDALYGMNPDGSEDFGIHLGQLASRGERGVLIVNLDSLLRIASNPFFPYVAQRIDEGIAPNAAHATAAPR
jgi:alpha-beta hydrolase superfamily lysophospholipase